MAINFPNSPVNGNTYKFNEVTYIYSKNGGDEGYWKVALPQVSGVATTAEVDAGTDTIKYISPAALQDSKYSKGDATLVTASNSTFARTLANRFAEVVNVKDFGAIGDGDRITGSGTDDTLAIRAAYAYADTLQSSVVYFPMGCYIISGTITVGKSTATKGDGIFVTEVQVMPNAPTSFVMFDIPDRGSVGSEKENRYCNFSDMSIDGNFNSNTEVHECVNMRTAIYVLFQNVEFKQANYDIRLYECSHVRFLGCLIRDSTTVGLRISGCGGIIVDKTSQVRSARNMGILLTDDASDNCAFACVFSSNQHWAVLINSPSWAIDVDNAVFINNGSNTHLPDAGALRVDDSDARNINCSNATFYSVFGKCIWSNATRSKYSENVVEGCRHDAFIISGSDCSVSDNDIYDAGYILDNTYDAISLRGANCTVRGNKVRSRRFPTEVARYGISVTSTATNPSVFDNDLLGAREAMNVDGAVSTVRHSGNIGSGDRGYLEVKPNSQTITTQELVEFSTQTLDVDMDYDTSNHQFISTAIDKTLFRVNLNCIISNGIPLSLLLIIVSDAGGGSPKNYTSADGFQINRLIPMNKGQVLEVFATSTGNSTLDNESTLTMEALGR